MEGNDMPADLHMELLEMQGVRLIQGKIKITGEQQPQQRMVASKDGEKKENH